MFCELWYKSRILCRRNCLLERKIYFSTVSSSFFRVFSAQHSCSLLQTRCKTEPVCIPSYKLCDGDVDCKDRSDEDRCVVAKKRCNVNEFKCLSDLTCIPLSARCNQRKDCDDGSDEAKCSKIHIIIIIFKSYNGCFTVN